VTTTNGKLDIQLGTAEQTTRINEMMKTTAKVAVLCSIGIFMASAASAQSQTNTNTNCNAYGSSIDCTSTSTTTQTGPTAAQVEQQKQMNENAAKTGAALGSIIAMKRAQHAQEKGDLTAVTFCRQNPYGSWTFPNKAPMPCPVLEKNVIAYCSVNAKKPICKDVAKLPPVTAQTANPEEERITINVVYCQQNPNGIVTTGSGEKQSCSDEIAHVTAICTVREWKGKPCEALSGNRATAVASTAPTQIQQPASTQPVQNVVAAQTPVQAQPQQATVAPQPAAATKTPQQQTADVIATPAPEVSVAEAARQARIAKAVREAKEKAERDNPPPPQQ
jgi:hypothetical protein